MARCILFIKCCVLLLLVPCCQCASNFNPWFYILVLIHVYMLIHVYNVDTCIGSKETQVKREEKGGK